ncbi:hypothetical protein B5S33_g448 [[Candida] boidinii]|nr:hypothetical protein B5S33_g448 [[Candida] boidinii]
MELGPPELKGKKYPSKEHALRVASHFKTKLASAEKDSAFFIAGTKLELYPYCDQVSPLRQNRYFHYLSGVNQISGCYILYNLESNKLTLFLPNIDEDDIIWSGLPLSPEQALAKYDVDEVLYEADVESVLSELKTKYNKNIYTTDTDEYKDLEFAKHVIPKNQDFFYALDEARLIKDEFELTLLRHASKISDNSHLAVMSSTPIQKNETHIHAEFVYHSIRQGSKFQSYDPICCSGPNCSTLHYEKNDDSVEGKHSVLIDAGAEWECYASDVTRCYPIDGIWKKEHREIYDLVLEMQSSAMEQIKPGTPWEYCHEVAHRTLIKGFLKLGLFNEASEDEIFESGVSVWFFPHGLGHLLGMDTHDVGGYPDYEDKNPMFRYLRLRRKLQKNMVLTNEPGCYFSPFLLAEAKKNEKQSSHINWDVVEKYMYIGGVRIEDDILVTEDGYENLTGITSDPDEVAKIVKSGIEKGLKGGFHNIV